MTNAEQKPEQENMLPALHTLDTRPTSQSPLKIGLAEIHPKSLRHEQGNPGSPA